MSSITQARLAPITQRYMSMSFRCRDWNEISTISSNHQVSSETAILRVDSVSASTTSSIQSSSSKPLLERERRFFKRGLGVRRGRVNVKSANSGSILARLSYVQASGAVISENPSRFQTCTYPPSQGHQVPLSIDNYLLHIKQRVGNPLIVNDALAISRNTPGSPLSGDLLSRCWKYERSRNRQSENDTKNSFDRKPFYTALAVLGLFRQPTEREVEEGRARLADEQKMKKMKPVELMIARGVLSMCDQDYGRADQLFHEALHIAQSEEDEERANLVLNMIAANYFESGELEKAEKLFIDIMKRMIAEDVAPTAPPILELSLKLASIYSKNPETHEKALKGFKFVINSLLYNLEDIVNNIENLDIHSISADKRDELALLGWSYDWFAKHLLNMNDYGGAADMLQRAVQISSLVLGPLHDQTLILLNDIGTTLAMNNSPEEGKIFIRKAVEGAIANQSNELASFYVNLGLVNLKLSKLDEAKRYCEYSMELAKKNRDHYNTQEVIDLSRTCLNEVQRLLDAEGQ